MKIPFLFLSLLPASFVAVSCGNKAATDDPYSSFDDGGFPYDEAGNYVGGGYDDAGSDNVTPLPNYDGNSGNGSYASNTDYSTPTAPSTSTPTTTYNPPPAPTPSSSSSSSSPSYNSYTVQRGDTLYGIARRFGTTVSAIKHANGMSSDTIVIGRTISVPGRDSGTSYSSSSSFSGSTHTIRSGDTLYSISRQYGVSIDALRRANGLSGNVIVTGRTLRIP